MAVPNDDGEQAPESQPAPVADWVNVDLQYVDVASAITQRLRIVLINCHHPHLLLPEYSGTLQQTISATSSFSHTVMMRQTASDSLALRNMVHFSEKCMGRGEIYAGIRWRRPIGTDKVREPTPSYLAKVLTSLPSPHFPSTSNSPILTALLFHTVPSRSIRRFK